MLRMMIVDDEDMIRNAIAKMIDFESLGFQLIATAKNGIEAYDIICDSYPDVVLTDIKMPGLNGLELIERATHLNAPIDFVILSGFNEFDLAKQALRFGVKNFILKPTDKHELIDTLIRIKDERNHKLQASRIQTTNLLKNYFFPLQECFIIESIENLDAFSTHYKRYSRLLSLPESGLKACICSFVDEQHVASLQRDILDILASYHVEMAFPFLYVTGSLVMVLKLDDLSLDQDIKARIESLNYENQCSSFESYYIHTDNSYTLFETLLIKVARYDKILLLNDNGRHYQIYNNITASWKINDICHDIALCTTETELAELLYRLFTSSMSLNTCKNLAFSIFIHLDASEEDSDIDLACHFFKQLYATHTRDELVSTLLLSLSAYGLSSAITTHKSKSLITELKEYVKTHLDAQNLSLKWIAENHLYVSVGYLSKQFVKEEQLRFSEYLNTLRMDEATKLLTLYPTMSIKTVANQVGFGNNPHYFSQVFKKHTGMTPSEFIQTILPVSEN